MAELSSQILTLVKATLQLCEEESLPLFASAEDCNFFRSLHRPSHSQKPLPSLEPEPRILAPVKPLVTDKPELPSPSPTQVTREKTSPPWFSNVEPTPPAVKVSPSSYPKSTPSVPSRSYKLEEIRPLVAKIAPTLRILDIIPSDLEAKRIQERWKTKNRAAPISMLVLQEPPNHKALLKQLALAIRVILGPTAILQADELEKEKQWETFLSAPELKWILCSDATLRALPQLLSFYRELPTTHERFLLHTPLFLLPDLSLYLKDPLLKRSLWKALCSNIA